MARAVKRRLAVRVSTMSDAEDEHPIRHEGIDNSIISSPIFEQAVEFPVKRFAGARILGQGLLQLAQEFGGHGFVEPFEVLLDGGLVRNLRRQGEL